jgi:hypothetical protein
MKVRNWSGRKTRRWPITRFSFHPSISTDLDDFWNFHRKVAQMIVPFGPSWKTGDPWLWPTAEFVSIIYFFHFFRSNLASALLHSRFCTTEMNFTRTTDFDGYTDAYLELVVYIGGFRESFSGASRFGSPERLALPGRTKRGLRENQVKVSPWNRCY